MNNRIGIKISLSGSKFLDRLRTNRRKEGTDNRDLGNAKLLDVIYQYFKKNDKNYKELLREEYIKNV